MFLAALERSPSPGPTGCLGFCRGVSLRGRRNFHHLRELSSRDRNKVGRMLDTPLRSMIGSDNRLIAPMSDQ